MFFGLVLLIETDLSQGTDAGVAQSALMLFQVEDDAGSASGANELHIRLSSTSVSRAARRGIQL